MFKHFFTLFLLLTFCYAELGVDVSSPVSSERWACLKKSGYSFAIVRAFHSTGTPDENAPQTLKNANSSGVSTDVYMFPCPKCSKSPNTQVDEMIEMLINTKSPFNSIWLDIEGPDNWFPNKTKNLQYISQLSIAVHRHSLPLGIYMSTRSYEDIVGNANVYEACQQCHLWWSAYGTPSFDGFKPFGGWDSPSMRQYYDPREPICDTAIDHDYRL